MKKIIAILSIAAIVGVAAAQEADKPLGLSLKFGVFLPTIAETRDNQVQTINVGAAYDLRNFKSKRNYSSGLNFSLDYVGRGDYRHIPLLLNYRGQFDSGLYYTAGVGVGFVRRPLGAGVEDVTRLAYQAGIGYNLGKGANSSFLEVRYIGSQAQQVNGVSVVYGFRF